jgi:hypothetical protein
VSTPPPAGYSATPLPKKLGIKEGHRLAVTGAPDDFRITLGELPEGVTVMTRPTAGSDADVIVAFFSERSAFEQRLPKLMEALGVDGGLWIAWPKRASEVETDITEDTLREVGLPLGLVDNKVCAIDETWSGLRLVFRKENRAALRADRA